MGVVLALLSFALALTTNLTTVLWSVGALVVTVLYPFAKRVVSMPQAVLGVAFSFGIPMAFTAQDLPVQGAVAGLVLGNLLWVLAYDTEYAMVDRDDDLKIGMKTSAITFGRWDVVAVMLCYIGYLALWAAVLWGRLPGAWLVAGLVASVAQVVWHYRLIRHRTREGCFAAFRANHWLGFTMFVAVAAGLALG